MDIKNLSVEELVKAYISLRDKKAELKAEFAKQQKPYDDALFQIESEMLAKMNDTGVESMKTAAGTAYKSIRSTVSVADKEAYKRFVLAQIEAAEASAEDPLWAFDFLDVKANKSAVEDFLAAKDELPPGINLRREEVVGFRRA